MGSGHRCHFPHIYWTQSDYYCYFWKFWKLQAKRYLSWQVNRTSKVISLRWKGGLDTLTFQLTPFSVVILAYT